MLCLDANYLYIFKSTSTPLAIAAMQTDKSSSEKNEIKKKNQIYCFKPKILRRYYPKLN